MSYSQLKAFGKNGDVICLETFSNSQYLTVIWNVLAKKYGIIDGLIKECAKEIGCPEQSKTAYYAARGKLMEDMQPVLDLQHNPKISDDDWYCLMFTLNHVVVPPDLIERVAAAFDQFEVEPNVVNHGKGFARCMRKAANDIEGIRGIALYGTSNVDDPFDQIMIETKACPQCNGPIMLNSEHEPWCETCDDYVEGLYEDYNLDKHSKHWFLSTREEWIANQKKDKSGLNRSDSPPPEKLCDDPVNLSIPRKEPDHSD